MHEPNRADCPSLSDLENRSEGNVFIVPLELGGEGATFGKLGVPLMLSSLDALPELADR